MISERGAGHDDKVVVTGAFRVLSCKLSKVCYNILY
jgi:hypothetical protein